MKFKILRKKIYNKEKHIIRMTNKKKKKKKLLNKWEIYKPVQLIIKRFFKIKVVMLIKLFHKIKIQILDQRP